MSVISGPSSPNAGGIAVKNDVLVRFQISSSVPEIFASRVGSHPKLGQILHVFGPRNFFWKGPPKILDQHYKIWPSADHHAKISRRSADASRRSRIEIKNKFLKICGKT